MHKLIPSPKLIFLTPIDLPLSNQQIVHRSPTPIGFASLFMQILLGLESGRFDFGPTLPPKWAHQDLHRPKIRPRLPQTSSDLPKTTPTHVQTSPKSFLNYTKVSLKCLWSCLFSHSFVAHISSLLAQYIELCISHSSEKRSLIHWLENSLIG